MKKLTQEQLIIDFVAKHGKIRYDYSNVVFARTRDKVIIGCNECGLKFSQLPSDHKRGRGCPNCALLSMGKWNLLTNEDFQIKANLKHNFKYIYLSPYINSESSIDIKCPDHDIFTQIAGNHLMGQGCPICVGKGKWTNDRFEKECRKIFGDLYDYSLVEYRNSNTPVNIVCKIHGSFKQKPKHHLMGHGCQYCGLLKKAAHTRKTTKEFIEEATKLFGELYDYSYTIYEHCNELILIKCKKCEIIFSRTPSYHLRGYGCPRCCINISRPELEWLDYIRIPQEWRQKSIKINNRLFKPDAIDKKNKIVYEFYGDYWHGNPDKYNSNAINRQAHKDIWRAISENFK
jgi:hypothetical protein